MNKNTVVIRPSSPEDIAQIQAIYAREVLEGTASFELTAPDLDEMRRRRETVINAGFPYLIAAYDERIAGYAYASTYRPRPAYRFSVENSVYVARWAQRRGVGGRLLTELIDACCALGLRQMIAIIGDSKHIASIQLHQKAGFRIVGTLTNVGFKFDRWLDTVIMQRSLAD